MLRSRTVAALALLTATATSVLGVSGPARAADAVPYPGSVPKWATSSNDAGPAAPDTTMEGEVYLPIQDPQGAVALATAVSTPGSADYRRFVTPEQWIDRFSPPADVYDGLVNYLKYTGLQITGTPESRLFVVFRGTVAQVSSTFGTTIRTYSVSGHRLMAPSGAPTLPAGIAASVSGMELDQGRLLTRPDSVPADSSDATSPKATPAAAAPPPPAQLDIPCSNYFGEHTATLPEAYGRTTFPTAVCGYVPSQLRAAYGVASPSPIELTAAGSTSGEFTGDGQTVAIIDAYASPTIQEDVNTYSQKRGEPPLTDYSEIVPPVVYDQALCQYPSGWQVEQSLDVEAVHAIAPAAGVLYVGGFNCGGGIDVAMSRILDQRLATIVSNSYGDLGEVVPLNAVLGQENLHLQAAAEGIGLYFSSGDSGDEAQNIGTPQPDYPASSPWVTAVGGTSTGITQTGSVALETGWGTYRDQLVLTGNAPTYASPPPGQFYAGGGGGRSTIFQQPAYQHGIVPDSLAAGMRVSPDLAADGDPYTGMLVGYTPVIDAGDPGTPAVYTERVVGGTSLASPLVAAEMALVQQAAGLTAGFANPAVYAFHRVVPSVPRDVTDANAFALAATSPTTHLSYLVTGNEDTSLQVAPGYDDVTGLGAIDFGFLRTAMTR